jgi:hypothetical protein
LEAATPAHMLNAYTARMSIILRVTLPFILVTYGELSPPTSYKDMGIKSEFWVARSSQIIKA